MDHPLSEVAFRRVGKTVVAHVQGLVFEPVSGQLLIAEVAKAVEEYFMEYPAAVQGKRGKELRKKLLSDADEMRKSSPKAKRTAARLEVRFT